MDAQFRNGICADNASHRLQEISITDNNSRVEPEEESQDIMEIHEACLQVSLRCRRLSPVGETLLLFIAIS